MTDPTISPPSSSPRQSPPSMFQVRKRQAVLNKFLTKTYHMIDTAPDQVAGWTTGGTSFTVYDISRFEKECLPSYFNHSKFTSFIRQLNFYGFQKLRSDADLQVRTESVRFAHPYFVKGQPDLLHKIQRTTAQKSNSNSGSGHYQHVPLGMTNASSLSSNSQGSSADAATAAGAVVDLEGRKQIEDLKNQVHVLKSQVNDMQRVMDDRVKQTALALTESYLTHVHKLEASYDRLLNGLMQQLSSVVPSSPPTTTTAARTVPSFLTSTPRPSSSFPAATAAAAAIAASRRSSSTLTDSTGMMSSGWPLTPSIGASRVSTPTDVFGVMTGAASASSSPVSSSSSLPSSASSSPTMTSSSSSILAGGVQAPSTALAALVGLQKLRQSNGSSINLRD